MCIIYMCIMYRQHIHIERMCTYMFSRFLICMHICTCIYVFIYVWLQGLAVSVALALKSRIDVLCGTPATEHRCVAVCCSVLQCVAVCCSVMQRVACRAICHSVWLCINTLIAAYVWYDSFICVSSLNRISTHVKVHIRCCGTRQCQNAIDLNPEKP